MNLINKNNSYQIYDICQCLNIKIYDKSLLNKIFLMKFNEIIYIHDKYFL